MTLLTRSNAHAVRGSTRVPDDFVEVAPPKARLTPAAPERLAQLAERFPTTIVKDHTMSTKSKKSSKLTAPTPPSPAKPKSLLSALALAYLAIALDRLCDPMHVNFRTKAKPETIALFDQMRSIALHCRGKADGNVKLALASIASALAVDVRTYTTYWKQVAGHVAFAAMMDCIALEKALDPQAVDEGLDAMLESHPILDDLPVFDVGELARQAPREAYAGPDERVINAATVDEAEDAVARVQEWISLGVSGLRPEQASYWGVDGTFPLGQRVDQHATLGPTYTPLRTLDAYRAWSRESWLKKRNAVPNAMAVADLLLQA